MYCPHSLEPPWTTPCRRGREDLAAAAGAPVNYFAYPHGKADTRSATAVRRAGFNAAFTGLPQPVRDGDDCHRLGRWEPGPLGVDDLIVNIAVRLHRAALRPRAGGDGLSCRSRMSLWRRWAVAGIAIALALVARFAQPKGSRSLCATSEQRLSVVARAAIDPLLRRVRAGGLWIPETCSDRLLAH
jgi:hypothetical protein